jgi:hypothetical protein
MKSEEMTEIQRQSLEHLERARSEGLSIKAYARAHGIPAQRIYDSVGRLRRRAGMKEQPSKSRDRFIKVKITESPASVGTAVCRISAPGGLVIECLQWPPRGWLESFGRAPDAAT